MNGGGGGGINHALDLKLGGLGGNVGGNGVNGGGGVAVLHSGDGVDMGIGLNNGNGSGNGSGVGGGDTNWGVSRGGSRAVSPVGSLI